MYKESNSYIKKKNYFYLDKIENARICQEPNSFLKTIKTHASNF